MAYATVDDVAARLGQPISEDEAPRIQAYLDDASAFIQDYCNALNWDPNDPPPSFKAVVCSEVIRWYSVAPGVVLERTGELETQFGLTAAAQGLSEDAKCVLRKYRITAATLSLRVVPPTEEAT